MVILELKKQIKAPKIVFINAKGLAVKLMFYIDCDATEITPEKALIDLLKAEKYQLVAFKSNLPDYVMNDKKIIKL